MAQSVSRAQRSVQRCAAEPGPILEPRHYERWVPALRSSASALHRVRDTRVRGGRSLQLQPDHAHQAVRHLLVALKLGGMRDQELAMIEIDQRQIIEHNLR